MDGTIATNTFEEFGKLAKAALQMTARRWKLTLPEDEQAAIEAKMKALPAFPESGEGLQMLKKAGFRLAALTNGGLSSAMILLKGAGLSGYFEQIYFVEQVKRYKPAPEPYQFAAQGMGVSLPEMTMVEAHSWDIAGAKAAGCKTAFLARPGKAMHLLGPAPDQEDANLVDLARRLTR